MIIGDTELSIDSYINKKVDSKSILGIGYFNVIIAGHRFGVFDAEATALGCSYNSIVERIKRRGQHIASFADSESAQGLAYAFRRVLYVGCDTNEKTFGLIPETFTKLVYNNNLLWAPDGSEAFDDSSYIIHFDIKDEVRLIGFRSIIDKYYDEKTLVDVRMDADRFYKIIEHWQFDFEKELKSK